MVFAASIGNASADLACDERKWVTSERRIQRVIDVLLRVPIAVVQQTVEKTGRAGGFRVHRHADQCFLDTPVEQAGVNRVGFKVVGQGFAQGRIPGQFHQRTAHVFRGIETMDGRGVSRDVRQRDLALVVGNREDVGGFELMDAQHPYGQVCIR